MDIFNQYRSDETLLSLINLCRDNAINNDLITKKVSQLIEVEKVIGDSLVSLLRWAEKIDLENYNKSRRYM